MCCCPLRLVLLMALSTSHWTLVLLTIQDYEALEFDVRATLRTTTLSTREQSGEWVVPELRREPQVRDVRANFLKTSSLNLYVKSVASWCQNVSR